MSIQGHLVPARVTQMRKDNTPNPSADKVMSRDVSGISGFSNERGVGFLLARRS